jgi:hypothetical protein
MNARLKKTWPLLAIFILLVSTVTCSPSADEATPTPTPEGEPPGVVASPTPTVVFPGGDVSTATPEAASPCDGLSGEIEVFVLVGPAAAVGLEPFSVGRVPFSVSGGGEPYVVQGQGHIPYSDVLTADWGTYSVTLDLDVAIGGECVESAGLDVVLDVSGSQFVEVEAESFHGEYPWEGEHTFNLVFPLVDGASAQGEGWAFVLHLN